MSPNLFKDISQQQVQEILKKYYADQDKGVQTSVNAFLVNTGKSLVLVDSGAASCFGSHLGSVLTNLKASGYQPEQVDTILLTHLHPDHVCGISKDGVANFPNATVYVSDDEANYWLDPNKQQNFQKTNKPTIKEQWKKLNKRLHLTKPNNALKRINSVMKFKALKSLTRRDIHQGILVMN
jgi:glyoxylase-like metal-dependent hydrolase (beta-lactamase superfamily II)